MSPPSPPLIYRPAYIGLFASLFLAAVCNMYLDIQYGGFVFESAFWAIVFGFTLRVAWRQGGEVTDAGRSAQKAVLIIGALMTVLIFIPMWGFPRAGLAILAMLQAAQNCVTVTRRGLHLGLLVSAVMVMFAASHHRADWSMLFYLVPYVAAVVFTLVAEQISRRAQDLRRESLGTGSARGQGVAIAAATAAILLGGTLLYVVTPQVTWPYLFWKFGQPGNIGGLGERPGTGPAGQQAGDGGAGGGGARDESGAGGGQLWLPEGRWPSPEEMREAAKRKGMPQWQSSAILTMADMAEATRIALAPIKLGLDELWNDIKQWLRQHWRQIIQGMLALILLAMLVAAWLLLREARIGLWLRTHYDYLRLGLLRRHAAGNAGAREYYAALQNLMHLQGSARAPAQNAREYLVQIGRRFDHLQQEIVEMTAFFEQARYGNREIDAAGLARMRANYRRIYRNIERLA